MVDTIYIYFFKKKQKPVILLNFPGKELFFLKEIIAL